MTTNNYGTLLSFPVVPHDSLDLFPTHYDRYGFAGYRVVPVDADKDTYIPIDRKDVGMMVYTQDTNKVWILTAMPSTWTQFTGSGSYIFNNGIVDSGGTVGIGGTITQPSFLTTADMFGVDGGFGFVKQNVMPCADPSAGVAGYMYAKLSGGLVMPYWEDDHGTEWPFPMTSSGITFDTTVLPPVDGDMVKRLGNTLTKSTFLDYLFYPGYGSIEPAGYTAPSDGNILIKAGHTVAKCTGIPQNMIIPNFAVDYLYVNGVQHYAVEAGSTVTTANFTWQYNQDHLSLPLTSHDPTVQSLLPKVGTSSDWAAGTGIIASNATRSESPTGVSITSSSPSSTVFTLSGTGFYDGVVATGNCYIDFILYRYWAPWPSASIPPSASDVKTYFSKEFGSARQTSKPFVPSSPPHGAAPCRLVFCYPATWGAPAGSPPSLLGGFGFNNFTVSAPFSMPCAGTHTENYILVYTNTEYSDATGTTWQLF